MSSKWKIGPVTSARDCIHYYTDYGSDGKQTLTHARRLVYVSPCHSNKQ